MINIGEVIETNDMVEKENLDVRTITLGISLLDCIDSDLAKVNENIYNKITTLAKNLVSTGRCFVTSAVSFIISPISFTASMLIPVFVEPTFTELHTRSVSSIA